MPNCDIPELKPFLNEKGQLTALPVKRKKRLLALYYLSQKMETGKQYTEGEINDLLNNWTTFRDPATLRRALYDTCLLERTRDGSVYRRAETIPPPAEYVARYT